MAGKKQLDDYSEIASTVIEEEARMERLKREQRAERENLIAQCYEMAGQIKTAKMFSKYGDVTSLMWLKQVKESKIYQDLPNIGTWEKYCKYLGLDRHTVDQNLLNLSIFGEELLVTVTNLRVGYRDIRKLRQLTSDGTISIDAEVVEIDGERIPLTPEHKDDLQAALDRAIDERNRFIKEQEKTIRIKERVSEDKEKKIQSLIEDIDKLEVRARAKGISPEEDALQQRIETFRIQFEGLFAELGTLADGVCSNPSPAVVANFISLMDNARMRFSGLREDVVAVSPPGMVEDDCFPPGLIMKS